MLDAVPAATASFAGATHVKAGVGTIRSGAGSILAVPPNYLDHFKTFRFLRGSLRPGEVVFDQQLAATLQVEPGDLVMIVPRRGRPPVRLRVGGIALVTAPDVLFQPLNPLLGPAPAQPPAEIAILPFDTFARKFAPELPTIASGGALPTIPGVSTGTQWQVQAQVDPGYLSGSPAHALVQATGLHNRVESDVAGRVRFVDNLSDTARTVPPATRSTPRRCTSCWRFREPSSARTCLPRGARNGRAQPAGTFAAPARGASRRGLLALAAFGACSSVCSRAWSAAGSPCWGCDWSMSATGL